MHAALSSVPSILQADVCFFCADGQERLKNRWEPLTERYAYGMLFMVLNIVHIYELGVRAWGKQ